jgi:hypothetical protein
MRREEGREDDRDRGLRGGGGRGDETIDGIWKREEEENQGSVKSKVKSRGKKHGGLKRISKEKERAEKGEGWINEMKVLERRGG